MKNRVYDALTEIKADEQLKQDTLAFLQKQVYQKRKKLSPRRFVVTFASLAIAVCAGIFSYNLYFIESAYMDIDVNPSVELTLNRFDRVIGLYAYNEEGQELLDAVDIKHKSYEDALAELVGTMSELGYLKDSGLFTATLQAKDGDIERKNLSAMRSCIDSVLQAYDRNIEQNIFPVDAATKAHAHEQNLTPAKYLAILELQELDPNASFDNCRNHSISEIKQQTRGHMNGSHMQSPESQQYGNDELGGHYGMEGANGGGYSNGNNAEQSEHHEEDSATQTPIDLPNQNINGEHGDKKNQHGHS